VLDELPKLIEANLPVNGQRSISGHSMGGHGALVISLRNPERYRSASAFSPISKPSDCPWGQKAFKAYLGEDTETWQQYDASILMQQAKDKLPTRVDQGLSDNFLAEQLKPETLAAAAEANDYPLSLYQHEGYDHSYYFISSFIEAQLRFHHKYLQG
jgi:S-formylglutathione hydrolase